MPIKWITPVWPAPRQINAISTMRVGGCSLPPFNGLNVGAHVGDNAEHVAQNRAILFDETGMTSSPTWLNQVHGTHVLVLPFSGKTDLPDADASYTAKVGEVCIVMTADCLPVLFCDRQGRQVAAAHAGWRGLLDGVLENTLTQFTHPHQVMAWLGPAIGADAFEVGNEVRLQFVAKDPAASNAFKQHNDRWLMDIYLLAKQRLFLAGVTHIYGGDYCTVSDPQRFFSYRREQKTGRQASCIWIGKD